MHIERIGPAERSPLATEVMVPMRDGVRLATDVYLPGGDTTPGPVILTRLPYDKNGGYTALPEVAEYFLRFGYRIVVQDVRGKFRSEGERLLFVNEADDGYDTIDWITKQPWSNGIVGMWGDSYYGFTQWAAVSTAHPALRAIAPRVTGTRLGELAAPIPGTHTREVEMGVHRMYPLTMFHDQDMLMWQMDWTTLPYHDTVEKFFAQVGSRSASYDVWYPNPVRLRRFRHGSPFDAPAVPVLMTIGWWDNCAPWQWQDHREIQRRPHWAINEYLLIEAIDHESNSHFDRPWLGGGARPTPEERRATLPRYLGPAVEFFDVFLRGAGKPADIPRVRWQLANADPSFRVSETWPPPETTTITLYPSDATAARGKAPGGDLGPDRPAAGVEATWKHDPTGPVPSLAPDPFAYLLFHPDQRGNLDRPDVLVFGGPPLAEPLDLVGPVSLRAQVRADGPELDLFAKLFDLAPDGSAHLIARGQVTVLAAGYDRDVEVDLGHAGYRLPAGHALGLAIAGSDAPEFVPFWGQEGNRWAQTTASVTTQSITLGGPSGAALSLTVHRGTGS
ncbi:MULTISPECIES: CocE/NonD family hydrolase [Amycolatopsis]|uniref:CocE/NonD family hydrolase n=1 Tax=Amycolatopsis TaxID=1813 RepID=UPI000B8A8968|nr:MULTISPECIES: CocE/NonD family hydrolase [Amycolatopsis]OXM72897.1 X-Pro dipeptidyl-peptidase [Amycolatopsis sp. KNN50.9b]